ncbi:hypothetical protein ACHAXN_007408 [Cyclotella atomus]
MMSDLFMEMMNRKVRADCGKRVFRGLHERLEQSNYLNAVERQEDGNIIEQLRTGGQKDKVSRAETHVLTTATSPILSLYDFVHNKAHFFDPVQKAIWEKFLFTQVGPTGIPMMSDLFMEMMNRKVRADCGKRVFRGLHERLEQSNYLNAVERQEDGNIIEQLRTGGQKDKVSRAETHVLTTATSPILSLYDFVHNKAHFFDPESPPIIGHDAETNEPVYADEGSYQVQDVKGEYVVSKSSIIYDTLNKLMKKEQLLAAISEVYFTLRFDLGKDELEEPRGLKSKKKDELIKLLIDFRKQLYKLDEDAKTHIEEEAKRQFDEDHQAELSIDEVLKLDIYKLNPQVFAKERYSASIKLYIA